MRVLVLAALGCSALSAAVCNPSDFPGAYGFQFSGDTTLSGTSQPVASIGRLQFDDRRRVSGVSSINLNGNFLGNPVTGNYELREDCTLVFELRDDYGAWQHFRGLADPGFARVVFRQTDPAIRVHGEMRRTASSCSEASFSGRYAFRISGLTTPFHAVQAPTAFTQAAETTADGNGGLSWKSEEESNSGTYGVDSDCFVTIDMGVPLRGILLDDGRTVLAVESGASEVAVAAFTLQ
jgi:hypothetical protein